MKLNLSSIKILLASKIIFSILIVSLLMACTEKPKDFEPTVESLQQYETPEWFGKAKFGIWVCWNAYTVPAVGDWYARNMYIEGHPHYKYHVANYGHPSEFGYKDIINLWKGEKFDAQELVDLFVESGAKYIVGMANHHDNFDLWNSKYQKWNSVNYGPKRDVISEFRDAVKKYENQGIRWGITSHTERAWSWFQTNKGADKTGPFAGVPYDGNDAGYQALYLPADPNGDNNPTQPQNAPMAWRTEWLNRCQDLIKNYDPDLFYVDGGVPFPGDDKGETGLKMISYLYNQNMQRHNGKNEAVMCIKDWYKKAPHGEWGYYWDGIATLDLERTKLPKIRKKPWQTDTSIGDWTYVKGHGYRPATEIIQELIDIVSKNGNMLLNVSPMEDGTLDPQAYQLLKDIGAWMKVNGESIYDTEPWATSGIDDLRIVKKGDKTLYISLFNMPSDNTILVPFLAPKNGTSLDIATVSILGSDVKPIWRSTENGLEIEIPEGVKFSHAMVFKVEGSSLGNYDNKPIQALLDRNAALKNWWNEQSVSQLAGTYQRVTTDNKGNVWAIKTDSTLVEIKDGKEILLGMKATDVGASAAGVVCVSTNGDVLIHTNYNLEWVNLPNPENQVLSQSSDGKTWVLLPGIKAKRCDLGQTGTVWVIDQNNIVHNYYDRTWKSMDKQADDIACGGGWIESVAIVNNGQLERFEGTYWENIGGKDLTALDNVMNENIIAVADRHGKIWLYDLLGSTRIDVSSEKINDVCCGVANGKGILLLAGAK